ncbi:metal-dependent transcriptional regulator [Halosimplex sp. J119]
MSAVPQYLLALYVLSHRGSPPLQTSDVADLLDRSHPSVTEMFKRLDEDGFVDYEPYRGVSLTETGRERAAAFHETYVTVSWYLRDALEVESPESRAIELAAVLGPDIAERLAAELPTETDTGQEFEAEQRTAPSEDTP